MTLSATDTIHRGLVNLRANWELILVQFLQILIGTVLFLVGFLPPLAVLGFSQLDFVDSSVADWAAVMDSAAGLVTRGREAWLLLRASIILSSVIWLMAILVHCYFQGGIYGVLMAGDRQAPPGKPKSRPLFRTFSARNLRGWAARYLWRYFWLLNLFMVIGSVWLVLPFVLFMLSVWGESRWGAGAALGIGCGGAIPVFFSLFVMVFWASLSQADLAREESSVMRATRQGLRVLGRRLGTVMILAVAGVIVWMTFAIAITIFTTLVDFSSGAGTVLHLGWQLALTSAQWVFGSVIGMAYTSILVALVRCEMPREVVS